MMSEEHEDLFSSSIVNGFHNRTQLTTRFAYKKATLKIWTGEA